MQIKQAFTYQYETKHFGKMLKHSDVVAGECFKNVKNFCKTYQEHGRNVRVSLVIGLRTWDDGGASYGYHYLVKDADTGEYTDPQYSRYTFIELHSWTPEEYDMECKEFEESFEFHPAQEFADHYTNMYRKQLLLGMKFIKSQGWCKVSDANLKDAVYKGLNEDVFEPVYGKKEIVMFNID